MSNVIRGTVNAAVSVSGSDGSLLDGVDPSIKATVKNYAGAKPLVVVLADTAGNAYVASGGGATAPGTATLSNISGSGTSQTALASNSGRIGASFVNDADAKCYLKFGTTASATSFSKSLLPGENYELPRTAYYGRIDVIWDATVTTGALRVTELTA